jgi:spore coat protein U-like protein
MKLNTLKKNQVKVLAAATGFAVAALLASGGNAQAATSQQTFQVQATVTPTCKLVSASTINFGAYDPVNTNATTALAGDGQLSIQCTRGTTTAWVGLMASSQGGTDTAARKMSGAASGNTDKLAYELYTPGSGAPNTACPTSPTTRWGDTSTTGLTLDQFTTKAPQTFNVCGLVAAGQDVAADTYSDTVTATVNF